VLPFCVVTGMEWAKAGITVETVRAVALRYFDWQRVWRFFSGPLTLPE
jgi:hypothetical protein